MKPIKLVLVLLAIFLVGGCTTSRITSSWKAPDAEVKKFNKIMVVGIIRTADRSIREKMENHLVDDLRALGYNALSSYVVYGPKTFENMTEQETNKKLAADGFDGVLTIVLLDKQRERYYVPGRVVYSPYIYYHNRFYGYYRSIYARIESPGYYDVTTRYFWESNLYDLTSDKLIYSVQTQSFDPASVESLAHEYGQIIVQNMTKNKVLGQQTEQTLKAM